ncbi:hypothetical protein P3X46_032640 [Hevea brasiliensis]|uniref:Uncharacterized protein n=1 Tax=Hevea brasiliensis TaxID=3981 RepID=A0ABQ9KFH8_HEVBR|nr:uncharacterized protein LOC110658527 [Hevea brasiliensis]KAJ9135458.1 hypothetical protein P3X46_032640 [Hevea brasiliensis]
MFRFVSKILINHSILDSKACYARYIQTLPSVNSTSISKAQSLTLSYLINSCGLSPPKAVSASKYVLIKSTDKSDLVLRLFRAHGFTKSQIATLISNNPQLILADPKKTLEPKIEYFESLGIAAPDLRQVLCINTSILVTSLKKRILPSFDFLRGLFETNENVILALKRSPHILTCGSEVMLSNIWTLRSHGVPEPSIRRLIVTWPGSIKLSVDFFEEKVREVKEMGFEPTAKSFIYAFYSMSSMSKSKWERKKKILMSFGWSEREIFTAFRVNPLFMTASEKKIKQLMEFYLTKACLQLPDLVRSPQLFKISLERTAIPRCSVLEVLTSKGLIERNVNVVSALSISKKQFENKFLAYFKEDSPELIQAYQVETSQVLGSKM